MNAVVGSLSGQADIPGNVIGKISIRDRHTFVDVPEGFVGKVLARAGAYRIGNHRVDIRLASDPTLMLVLMHVADVQVEPGVEVVAGETQIGEVRAFARELDQALRRFTSDNGDHAQLMVLRVASELGEF